MKIKAIIFMSNDIGRLDFTLSTFKKHNPTIPVLVYDNGSISSKAVADKYGYSYKKIENIWHKKTHCGVGSFDYRWFELLFEYGLEEDEYTHILFLETDVYTRRPIRLEPIYDMSGPMNISSPLENIWFDYFDLKSLGYSYKYEKNTVALFHTGCGGTIYKKEFFKKCQNNLPLIKRAYEEKIEHFYMDLLISLLCVISNCSIGDWPETTNLKGNYIFDKKKDAFVYTKCNWSAAMIHNVKFVSKYDLFKNRILSYVLDNRVKSRLTEAFTHTKCLCNDSK